MRPRASDARALAWEILRRVEEEQSYADVLLGHRLRDARLPVRDQALATRLVYGTIAWQGYLDHIIAACARRPPEALDAPIRTLLRLALFQICLLTKIPPFAAVATAVELAKRVRGGAAAPLVNAVLRGAASTWRHIPLPAPSDDPAGFLSIRFSHPRWLVERWLGQYGMADTEALLRANNEAAPTVVRVNALRTDRATLLAQWQAAGHPAAPTRYSPIGIALAAPGMLETLPGYQQGRFTSQGEASQLVALVASPPAGARVLDACAAPGGKTTHMAEHMANRGTIVALDTHTRGAARVARLARRLGLSIVHAAVADATVYPIPDGVFDCVLVDAPCSGFGTLRQHPEVKWRRTPEDVRNLSELQLRLLRHLSAAVRPGGVLVYATCTLSMEENEAVVGAFLRETSQFAVDDPRALLPESAPDLVGADGMLRTFPHRHGLDGFFAVRVKRRP